MESLCSFDPAWSRDEAIVVPRDTIKVLRERIVNSLLRKASLYETQSPSIDNIIEAGLQTIDELFQDDASMSNVILKRLRQAAPESDQVLRIVKEAIHQWYRSAVPAVTRDPSSGLVPTEEGVPGAPGTTIEIWERDRAAEQFFYGNMGLIGMLMTSEPWQTAPAKKMFAVSLCANSMTSLLYSAYMIVSATPAFPLQESTQSQMMEGLRLYIRTAWLLARDSQVQGPGLEFGATTNEIKVSNDGRRLMSKVGRVEWAEAPLWHPVRRVPGSAWNKFIRNTGQKIFQPAAADSQAASQFQIPSSALTLVEPWEQYYAEIRRRFDQTGRQREALSTPEQRRCQFARLSEATGSPYKERELKERTALQAQDINQAYAYHLPMVKKAISDARGMLTLPFVTTAGRALRFEEDPPELEPDLFLMKFET
ncbi:mating-type protein MAT 1-1-2 [Sarocladium implicatum]|nr:mating-type protein MAT 1-1-2 [Sarocladium implicatum]